MYGRNPASIVAPRGARDHMPVTAGTETSSAPTATSAAWANAWRRRAVASRSLILCTAAATADPAGGVYVTGAVYDANVFAHATVLEVSN